MVNEPTARSLLLLEAQALLEQCAVDCYRSSGPGGQKKNKTSSAVRLRHGPTGLSVIAEEDRSQHVNKARALRRLRVAIALHIRAPVDIERYERSAELGACFSKLGRLGIGRRDERYPLIVCEILDVLVASGLRVSDAAAVLGMSTAHLVKFLHDDAKIWARVNQMRLESGLKPLR